VITAAIRGTASGSRETAADSQATGINWLVFVNDAEVVEVGIGRFDTVDAVAVAPVVLTISAGGQAERRDEGVRAGVKFDDVVRVGGILVEDSESLFENPPGEGTGPTTEARFVRFMRDCHPQWGPQTPV
jgi:hypothetical protein